MVGWVGMGCPGRLALSESAVSPRWHGWVASTGTAKLRSHIGWVVHTKGKAKGTRGWKRKRGRDPAEIVLWDARSSQGRRDRGECAGVGSHLALP